MKIKFGIVLLCLTVVTGCGTFSGSTPIPLSQDDIQDVVSKIGEFSNVPDIGTFVSQNPHRRIYKVAFDGTENDKENVPRGERPTVAAHIAELTSAKYYPGPGTGWWGTYWLDSMFGYSSVRKAEQAKADFIKQAAQWLMEDPDAEIFVFVTGFSRGAAIARHFMNIVERNWTTDLTLENQRTVSLPRFYAMLFDTVATGQSDHLLLALPRSLDYIVHFVAADEMRSSFFTPLVDTDSNDRNYDFFMFSKGVPRRINTVLLPGAHSDMGISYINGIGNVYLVLVEQLLNQLGLISKTCWNIQGKAFDGGKHDSRGLIDKLIGRPQPNSIKGLARRVNSIESAYLTESQFIDITSRLSNSSFGNKFRTTMYSSSRYPAFEVIKNGRRLDIVSTADFINPQSAIFIFQEGIPSIEYTYTENFSGGTAKLAIPIEVWMKLPEAVSVKLSTSLLRTKTHSEMVFFIDDVKVWTALITAEDATTYEDRRYTCPTSAEGIPVTPIKAMVISPTENGFQIIPLN